MSSTLTRVARGAKAREVGNKILQVRYNRALSQVGFCSLAAALGVHVTPTTISRIESGHRVSQMSIRSACAALAAVLLRGGSTK